MGEEAWRVYRIGSLANDCIRETRLFGMEELRKRIPSLKHKGYLLVTYHPETLNTLNTSMQIKNLLDAIDMVGLPAIFTYPNVDAGNHKIIENVEAFAKSRCNATIIKNAGVQLYYSLVKHAAALVGNSSSGIYDTPYFCVPAINVGRRQAGRTMGANVINVEGSAAKIEKAIKKGLSDDFRSGLGPEIRMFFGDGYAAVKVVNVLSQILDNNALLEKRFCSYM
jgi:GDP/UDP-N,N'-diacetylbacillosamine 2-epimerase (hydrolysing)